MLLTLFVTTAILAGLQALDESRRAGWWARLFWMAMGLAVLVKEPVGLLIPVVALGGLLLLIRDRWQALSRLVPWEGPALFAVFTLPWFSLVLAANGWAFVEGFLIKHHITRYTGVISSHAGPIWFYVPVLLVGFFPWGGLLPAALWRSGKAARLREGKSPADRLLVVCACWVIGVFVLFSFAGTKLPSYLYPAFPAFALLVGATSISTFKPIRLWRNNRPTGEYGRLPAAGYPLGGQLSAGTDQVPRWLDRVGL